MIYKDIMLQEVTFVKTGASETALYGRLGRGSLAGQAVPQAERARPQRPGSRPWVPAVKGAEVP